MSTRAQFDFDGLMRHLMVVGFVALTSWIAASTTGTSNEFVELVAPADGDYQVWVQGWSVAGTPTVKLSIDAIQGNDLTVSGVPAKSLILPSTLLQRSASEVACTRLTAAMAPALTSGFTERWSL